MAKHRRGVSDPVVKKGGFLGKFVAFLLGFVLGIGAIVGAVAGVVAYVMSNTLHNTASLLDGFAPGFYAMMFGADGQNNGILDEGYANKTVADLLGDSMNAVSTIQNGDGSLQALSDIFPIVGNFAAQLAVELDNYSVPVDYNKLMSTPISGLKDYLMDSVKQAALGDFLKAMGEDGNDNKLMNALSYGEKGVDYTIDSNGEIVMLNGAKKTTINDLMSEDGMDTIMDRLPLDAVMDVDMEDSVMCAIAYGSTERYTTNAAGDVVMKQVVYTYEDKGNGFQLYDDKDNIVDGSCEFDGQATPSKITLANGEVQYLKKDAGVYKAYLNTERNKPALYKKTKIGDLSEDSMSIINNIYLKDALDINADSHKVLISLAYGEENVDYEFVGVGASRTIQPIGNAKPRTIGDLRARGGSLIDEIPLTDITTEDRDNGLIMYLLYGREDVHYKIDKTTDEVVMLQKHIAILETATETNVYNEYGEALPSDSVDTKTKTYTDEDGKVYSYAVGTHEGARTSLKVDDVDIPVYYLFDEGGAVNYSKTTLGDMAGSNNILSNLTSRITVGEVMDKESVENSKFLKHVMDETIDDLPEAINELTLQTVYADEIFKTDEDGNFLDKDGNITTDKDEYVVEHEWWYLLHDEAVCENEHGEGRDKECIQDYKITEMGVLIDNMRTNIEMATLFQLKADGMIDGLDDDTLNSKVRTTISGQDIDMGDLPQGENVKLGDYTVVQMLNYVNAIFDAIDEIEGNA